MNERAYTLGAALLALALVVMLLFPNAGRRPPPPSVPTSADRGEQGLAGLRQWLENSGVPHRSLRQRYHALFDPTLPASGNLLITVVPHRDTPRLAEREELQTWLAQGNHLLVLAALSDWPAWAWEADVSSLFRLSELLGLELRQEAAPEELAEDDDQAVDAGPNEAPGTAEAQPEERAGSADLRQSLHLEPAASHPLTAGVREVEAVWDLTEQRRWRLVGSQGARAALVLLRDAEDGAPALWQLRVGDGAAWISRHADLFGNRSLGRADNARLAANLIAAALGPGGQVIFDDMHHGLADLYDPQAFFKDPRLHHTLGFLLLLWGLYVVGHSNRLGPPAPAAAPVRLVDQVRAVGGLFARRLHPAAAAERLLHHFFNDIRAQHGLPQNGRPAWEPLARSARVPPARLAALRRLHARARARRRLDLVALVNHLQQIRKAMR